MGSTFDSAHPAPWHHQDDETEPQKPLRPPVATLYVGGALVVAALLLWLPRLLAAHVAGYLLATFGALGAVALFQRQDLQRRQSVWYSPQPGLRVVRVAVAVAAVAVAATHVWVIATWVAEWR